MIHCWFVESQLVFDIGQFNNVSLDVSLIIFRQHYLTVLFLAIPFLTRIEVLHLKFVSIAGLCRRFGFSSWVGLGWSFRPYYSYLITSKEICKSETFYVMLCGIISYRVIVNFMQRILLQLWFFVHSTNDVWTKLWCLVLTGMLI